MNLDGVFPPVATPFLSGAGPVDLDALRFNARRWMATGLRGLVVLGSNGEAALLDEDEADAVVGAARECVPRDRLLIAGTGRESTRGTIAATKRAAALGADLALVRAPGFFKGAMTAEALRRHYVAVADASPIPVLLYNFAAVFGVNLATETIAQLAQHPNIAGLKESGGDVAQVADQVAAAPDGFQVVVGAAPALYASLCVGAAGGVVAVANAAPEACVRLHALARAGRHEEALALQRALTPLARAVTGTYGVAGLKAAMGIAGYKGGVPRAPLQPAPPAAVEHLTALVAALDAFLAGRAGAVPHA
jgi:4-hydroxy-2-oxoglutarate aldolase